MIAPPRTVSQGGARSRARLRSPSGIEPPRRSSRPHPPSERRRRTRRLSGRSRLFREAVTSTIAIRDRDRLMRWREMSAPRPTPTAAPTGGRDRTPLGAGSALITGTVEWVERPQRRVDGAPARRPMDAVQNAQTRFAQRPQALGAFLFSERRDNRNEDETGIFLFREERGHFYFTSNASRTTAGQPTPG